MSKADKPAYPINDENCSIRQRQGAPDFMQGMTLLEHYAGLAMQGLVCSPLPQVQSAPVDIMAGWAVQTAQALIAELEKVQP